MVLRVCGHVEYAGLCLDCQHGEAPPRPGPNDMCCHGRLAKDCRRPHSPYLQPLRADGGTISDETLAQVLRVSDASEEGFT